MGRRRRGVRGVVQVSRVDSGEGRAGKRRRRVQELERVIYDDADDAMSDGQGGTSAGDDEGSNSGPSSSEDSDTGDSDSSGVVGGFRQYESRRQRQRRRQRRRRWSSGSDDSNIESVPWWFRFTSRACFATVAAALIILVILFFTVFVVGLGTGGGAVAQQQRRIEEWKRLAKQPYRPRGGSGSVSQSGPYYPWKEWRLAAHKDCKGWSIGIGFAASPLSRVENWTQVFWPALQKDRDTVGPWALAADPFLVPASGRWYMFYEMFGAFEEGSSIGKIGWATQEFGAELQPWVDGGQVQGLKGNHQSYPYVVYDQATRAYYMLPQISGEYLTLYQAVQFPSHWTKAAVVDRTTTHYYDSNIVHWHGTWYIFAGLYDDMFDRTYTQRILVSRSGILGPYMWHPAAPLPSEHPGHFGRNAGRMVPFDGGLVRFTQYYRQQSHRYGEIVRATHITHLSPEDVTEEYDVSWVVSLPADTWPEYDPVRDARAWNAKGAHHVDMVPLRDGRWMVAFDGREGCAVTKARPQYQQSRARAQVAREEQEEEEDRLRREDFEQRIAEQRQRLFKRRVVPTPRVDADDGNPFVD